MRRPRSCSLFPLVYPLAFFISGLGRQSSSLSMTMTTTTTTTTGSGLDSPEAEARGAERCSFPSQWEGNWFQSGVHQTITISRYTINIKGRCLEADGEKYLVEDQKKLREHCYRCVVFHEKHQNVLQYKETFCIPERRSLKDMCTTITGDANLFSLFRMEPVPLECPFRGPFTFTYNRGHGECRYPLSTIESCIHPSRLILNYQACPDVPGTESTVEELQCLAMWKEGSSRYLLGLIQYRHHSSFEERFRCFVYEKIKKGNTIGSPNSYSNGTNSDSNVMFRVAQSGDATCNGLTPLEGSRTMTLRKAVFPKPSCNFPSWLQAHAQWHTLDLRSTFAFDGTTLRVSNSSDISGFNSNTLVMSATCSQILDNPTLDKVMLILYTTSDCRSGYTCATIYSRDGHIVELQMGNLGRRAEDACHVSHFNQTQLPYITLVSSTPATRQCPYLGRFQVTGLSRDGRKVLKDCSGGYTKLQIGCNQLDTFQLRSECSRTDVISEFACHGTWEEMGVTYLITSPLSRASTGARRYCFVFRESTTDTDQLRLMKKKRSRAEMLKLKESGLFSLMEDTEEGDNDDDNDGYGRVLQFSSIADSCRRHIQPGVEGHLAFNVSSEGQCNDINGSTQSIVQKWILLCPLMTLLPSLCCIVEKMILILGQPKIEAAGLAWFGW